MDALEIDDKKIPDFRDLNARLKDMTGWEVVAVPGLIPDVPFFQALSERKFPAGNFIRRRDQLNYIQEPDVFHDVFGHVPLLANPVFGGLYLGLRQGRASRAWNSGTITNLARLYWFTVEFGLIDTKDGLRIYGAGILSSPGESVYSLEDQQPQPHRFRPEAHHADGIQGRRLSEKLFRHRTISNSCSMRRIRISRRSMPI